MQEGYPISRGLKKEENVSRPLWCFRIYHKLKSLRDTAEPHKGNNCEGKVSGVRNEK